MNTILRFPLLTLFGLIAVDASALDAHGDDHLTGTYIVTETFSDNSVSKGLITFAGKDDEGTLISSFDASLSSPHPCFPEQGTWKKIPGHVFHRV